MTVPVAYMTPRKRVIVAAIWMFGLAILLFWLPVIGPFFAGVVGGKKAGGVWHGFLASVLPSVLIGVFLLFGFTFFMMPFFGALLGVGLGVWILLDDLAMIAGAVVGGLLA